MSSKANHPYHLVDPSPWPLISAFSALMLTFGTGCFILLNTGKKPLKSKNASNVGNFYYTKNKKSLINKQILKWRKTVSVLLKYYD